MAEDFQGGMCESKWWNTGRSTGWIAPPAEVSVSMAASTISCSYTTDNITPFSWSSGEIMESKARPTDNLMSSDAFMAGSSFSIAGSSLPPPANWNQFLMGGDQRNSHDMINEELSSRPNMGSDEVQLGEINQALMLEQHHLISGNEVPRTAYLTTSTAYENPSSIFLQDLIDSTPQHACDRTNYDIGQNDKNHQSLAKFSQFLKNSLPSCEPSPKWSQNRNAIADPISGFYASSMHAPFLPQNFEEKPNITSITTKQAKVEQEKNLNMGARKGANEPAFKKARAETPSPLPTFKVRKEKLSDRVTALQQLVSPFGKTDTASVLYEAIEYIKFLHDQVNVLSAPYLKNAHPMQPQQVCEKSTDGEAHKKDLRSKGLCLVPISSTFAVTNENMAEFWTPTFGGFYR